MSEQKEVQFEKVVQINPAEISDFPNHPFQVRQDEAMAEMVGKYQNIWRFGSCPCMAESGRRL